MITKKSFVILIILSCLFLKIQNQSIHNTDSEYQEYDVADFTTKPPHSTSSHSTPSHPKSGDIEHLKSTISLSLFDDPLRQGLQPFYVISNFLIDDVLKTSIPKSK